MTEPSESPGSTPVNPATPAEAVPGPYSYPPGPYQASPHQGGPYESGAYQQGAYQPGSYQPGTYPPGPYQPGPYQGGYPAPPYWDPAAAPMTPRNGLGVAALIVGVCALIGSFSIAGGIVLGIVAVILGFVGRGRVRRGEATNGGVATAGIVLGVLGIIAGLIFVAIWVGLFKEVGAGGYFDCLQQAGEDRALVEQCANEFRQSVEDRFSVTPVP
jgi:hypothetical protein